MQTMLEDLYKGKDLNEQQLMATMKRIIHGESNEVEISALLIALKIKGESPKEIAGVAQALRETAKPFPRPDEILVDTCGTGGDGKGTINISTITGLVAAECGLKVVKHGNRSVSSKCGSSDILAQLGVKLDCSPEQSRQCLDELNFCFLMAPIYHQGMKHAMPVRQKLKTRTLFNLIGPLTNPSQPDIQLMGVYDAKLLKPMAEALNKLGCKRAFVVNGGGLDEIALHTETNVAYLNKGEISNMVITPEEVGLERIPLEELMIDDTENTAEMMTELVSGKGKTAYRNAIAINTAAILFLADKVNSLKEGVTMALSVLNTDRVASRLHSFVEMSNA